MLPERVVGSDETELWRTVLDQAMQDAWAKPRAMPDPDDPEKARNWLGYAGGSDFALVCEGAGLETAAMKEYAKGVIDGGGRRRRRARRTVG